MTIINDILDFSKIEHGNITLEKIKFDPIELFQQTIRLFNEKFKEKGLNVLVHVDPKIPETAYGDPTRVKQVFSNLLSNAVKFSFMYGQIDVTLWHETKSKKLFCSLKDTGVGIAPDKLEKIFDPYEQEDASTTRKYQGTGLGLSISKSLVELMGGELKVNSRINKGSEFTFSVKVFDEVEQGVEPEIIEAREYPKSFSGNVLIIEDNVVNCRLLEIILKKLGLDTKTAFDGYQGLQVYETNKFDLIFVDENMPNMSGTQVANKIHQAESEAGKEKTPIVAITANVLTGDREKFLEAGLDEYIAKPFSKEDIVRVLEIFLTSKKEI